MKSNPRFPFAVRLIGFSSEQEALIDRKFAEQCEGRYRYFRLLEDNLQDPDLFLANAEESKALDRLSYFNPTAVRPLLLVGMLEIDLPYPRVPILADWPQLFKMLDKLVEIRADALARLEASDVVTVPERRRKERCTNDLADPTEYIRMRRQPLLGGVLIIDNGPDLCDYVASLLARRKVAVNWVHDEPAALEYCRKAKISLVMINTSAPRVDPYRLCKTIKTEISDKMTVIFLVGKSFTYDQPLARRSGCDGFLNKPVTGNCLVSTFKKFLPQAN